ncbi:MAG: hypothetical protein OSJ69_19510 [Acetatifactor sp.]|nr:hypothetical protein [Acetatifactor sp.]
MKYLAFPWGPLGNMLRRLSLSGGAGNVTAWILFLAAGALPVVCWGVLFLKKRAVKADWLLFLLSAAMFAGLWLLVNPSYLEQRLFPPGIGEMGRPAVALTIDSILLTWVFGRFLEKYEKLGINRLLRSLQVLLVIFILLIGISAAFEAGYGFAKEYAALKSGNTALREKQLMPSIVFLFLQTVCAFLPKVLELFLWSRIVCLLRSFEKDCFSRESLGRVEGIKRLSALFLVAVLFGNLGMNLLQLILASRIYSSHYVLVLPLREIIVLLVMVLLSRFYLLTKHLKEDNELFV